MLCKTLKKNIDAFRPPNIKFILESLKTKKMIAVINKKIEIKANLLFIDKL